MGAVYNPVGWFEIAVTDMARARAFYEAVLQLSLEVHEMDNVTMAWFPMADKEYGSLVQGSGNKPSKHGSLLYFTAPDIDASLDRVTKAGGKVLSLKTSIGEYGFVGFFEDTEGNRIGLHSRS
jgi:predicted enzyme related to lactoylglutathione lyase